MCVEKSELTRDSGSGEEDISHTSCDKGREGNSSTEGCNLLSSGLNRHGTVCAVARTGLVFLCNVQKHPYEALVAVGSDIHAFHDIVWS
jgi:hypothetical protein